MYIFLRYRICLRLTDRRHKTGSHFPWQCVYTCHINLTRKKRSYIVMIKLNNICIQYTAWCRRDTATSLTHTPWSTRLGPARSQHRKSDETIHRIRGIDPRNGIGESGWENIFSPIVWLTGENQNSIEWSIRIPPMRGSSGLSNRTTRRVDYNRH